MTSVLIDLRDGMKPAFFLDRAGRSPRLSGAEKRENLLPAGSCGSQLQNCSEPAALWAIERQDVEASCMRGVLRPFQNAPLDECLDRLRDLLHLVPQKSGELFTGQERSRMSMEENEQVEVAGRANDGSAGKKPLDLFHAGTVCGTLVAHKPIPIRPHGSLSAQEKRRPKIAVAGCDRPQPIIVIPLPPGNFLSQNTRCRFRRNS